MEAKKGIDVILLYRLLNKSTEESAWKMAFQTEHDNKMSVDTDSTPTKDGPIQNPGSLEYDFFCHFNFSKGRSSC